MHDNDSHAATRELAPVTAVTAPELESLSLRVAQARSTVALLRLSDQAGPDLQNALGLLTLCLDQCAEDLSDLHRRQEAHQETRR
jgi:hypothetical protein